MRVIALLSLLALLVSTATAAALPQQPTPASSNGTQAGNQASNATQQQRQQPSNGQSQQNRGQVERNQGGNNNNNNRGRNNDNNNDANILNFALTLELLEASFYAEALRRFPEAEMRRAGVANAKDAFANLFHLLEHETTHVRTLDTVIRSLGVRPVSNCEFQFDLPNVQTFLQTARVLEKVGVSAYAGALASLRDPKLQTAGATIGTVEARHSSFLNALNNIDPAPEAFDVPLTANQVITLASPFIRRCDVDLGIRGFQPLTVQTTTARPGDLVRLGSNIQGIQGNDIACNWLIAEKSVLTRLQNGQCQVPPEARGDVYLMVVRGNRGVSLDNTNAIIAGPAVFPVDTFALDSCSEIHGSQNQRIRINQDVRGNGRRS